ncbi:hypothetical protein CONCODRAFT_80323 [Conidiobolus coronatus NRRL 28638]|uniref:G domain-containing protein n=1 Tax=Conidiobolus coronatus (strain ATCC 28846 / CBS 209.66 / NRRL 28638) TaxID=796925 RepID=A0A137NW01_CONC2|nr:hypothetical protein CONCODRAFT_80323 [Conidiobolus coronatus NRRL 28638]|eukprot:KXN66983.1 hypothetical protein CONCODRAFT_80323 [Conidiobolus coronatus NRRL 28638]
MNQAVKRILINRQLISKLLNIPKVRTLSTPVYLQKLNSSTSAKVDRCLGCGAHFQSENSKQPGYLPTSTNATNSTNSYKVSNPSKQLSNLEYESLLHTLDPELKKHFNIVKRSKQTVCQRCFHLTRYNSMSTDWKTNAKEGLESLKFLKDQPKSVIVMVVDVLDLENTLIKELPSLLDGRKFVLVCNKVDLLPTKVFNKTQTLEYIYKTINKYELKEYLLGVHLLSAKNKTYSGELVRSLAELTNGSSDIYLIGYTNVGKSNLMNLLLHDEYKLKSKVTTSLVPGTTMKLLGIPGSQLHPGLDYPKTRQYHIFDTPGIHNDNSYLHYLSYPEILECSPKKDDLKVCTNQILPGRSFFLGGLLRLDNIGNDPVVISNFTKIPFHRTNLIGADNQLKKRNMELPSEVLYPPFFQYTPRITELKIPKLEPSEPLIIPKTSPEPEHSIDIIISGLGWLSLSTKLIRHKEAKLQPYTLGGKPLQIRDAMISG